MSLPYLGSKISLISKSQIRYEGILYTIDTKESTVALQSVRSYGTEGRKGGDEIPPSNEVYDYIIFRGSDITELNVCEVPQQHFQPQPHPDPAIVQVPPVYGGYQSGFSPMMHPNYPASGYPPGVGLPGGPNPYSNPYFYPYGYAQQAFQPGQQVSQVSAQANPPQNSVPPTQQISQSAPSQVTAFQTSQNTQSPQGTPQTPQTVSSQAAPLLSDQQTGSQQTTTISSSPPPVLSTSSTPTTPTSTLISSTVSHNTNTTLTQAVLPTPSLTPITSTQTTSPSTSSTISSTVQTANSLAPVQPVPVKPESKPTEPQPKPQQKLQNQPQQQHGHRDYQQRYDSRNSYHGNHQRDNRQQQYQQPGVLGNRPKGVGVGMGPGILGGAPEGQSIRGGRGGSRGPRRYSNSTGGNQPLEEFDFESANARFDKEKLVDEMKVHKQYDGTSDGTASPVILESEVQPENLASSDTTVEVDHSVEDKASQKAYDKNSSFFDSLSCDSLDRLKEQTGDNRTRPRHSLAEQRKLDAETFGQLSLNDRNRGHRGGRGRHHGSNLNSRGNGERNVGGQRHYSNQNNFHNNYNRNPVLNQQQQQQGKMFRPIQPNPYVDVKNQS